MLKLPLWLRLSALLIAVALILWLPIEDLDLRYVLLFAALITAWWAARFLVRLPPDGRSFIMSHIVIGTLSGAAVTPLALLLMVFKSGLHAHGQPDFTLSQMQAILARTPVWALAGFLIALGLAILRLARKDPHAPRR